MEDQNERDRVCYEQHSESFRHLNSQMWQVPMIAMTLTGGLWYGIFTADDIPTTVTGFLLVFCAACDFLFILILWRVRFIMSLLIDKLNMFNEDYAIRSDSRNKKDWLIKQDKLVVYSFSIMLGLAGVLSIYYSLVKFDVCKIVQ